MQPYEGTFRTPDGVNLFELTWKANGKPKGAVVIVHGFGEHCARHSHVAEKFVQSGYSVYTFDLRGHGRSEGPRGFVRSFGKYIDDLDLFIKGVRLKEHDGPLFLLGHSMGGAIATLFSIKHGARIDGLVLSSALVKNPENTSPFFLCVLSLLSKVLPTFPVLEKINGSDLSRDPGVVERYDADPLVYHGKMVAREAAEIAKAIKTIKGASHEISVPILILHGTSDRVTEPKGSEELYESVSSTDKTIKTYDGFYHEIMNEHEKGKVLSDIISWMDGHL